MGTVLFLCSGNYYRSRFAEHLFNARRHSDQWQAHSRGLVVDRTTSNVGPMSPLAVAALTAQGVELPASLRDPQQVTAADLAAADLVIALKEREHRPMLQARFPDWADHVIYWHIHDLDCATADQALSELSAEVDALLIRL